MASDIETTAIADVADLFGGVKILKVAPRSPLEAHDLLIAGLPGAAIGYLIDRLNTLPKDKSLENAVGMSFRTFQRRRESASKPLTPDQSGRAWKFAEILAKATDLFGSQDEAERWLQEPAMGLDNRKPIDLLATPAGTEMIETFLTRLDYGVYM